MNDDRAREGVEHLQTAALEVISALRAFLDVAEELVRQPAAAGDLAASVAQFVRGSEPTWAGGASGGEPRVRRIRVS